MPSPRDNQNPTADRIIQRALVASAAFYDTLQEEMDRRLKAKEEAGASPLELLQEAMAVIAEFTDPLTALLAESELTAWIAGAGEVADLLPEAPGQPQRPIYPPGPFDAPSVAPGRWKWQGMDVWLPLVEKASEDLRSRNLVTKPEFDVLDEEFRAKAFTVAGLKTQEAIGQVRDAVLEAVEEGTGFRSFKETVDEALETSPLGTGHLENVFRTNVGAAYANAKEELGEMPIVKEEFPFRRRSPIRDSRLTELCEILAESGLNNGPIYLATDPVYQKYRIPSHFQCRCTTVLTSIEDAAERGVTVAQRWLETGIPPGAEAWVQEPPVAHLVPKGWSPGGR